MRSVPIYFHAHFSVGNEYGNNGTDMEFENMLEKGDKICGVCDRDDVQILVCVVAEEEMRK